MSVLTENGSRPKTTLVDLDADGFDAYLSQDQDSDDFDEYAGLHEEPDPEPDFDEFEAEPVPLAGASEPAAPFVEPVKHHDVDKADADLGAATAEAATPDPDAQKFSQYTHYTPETEEATAETDPAAMALHTDPDAVEQTRSGAVGAEASSEPEADDDDAVDPRTVRTKVGLLNSPFTRMVLIGGSSLLVCGAFGLFLSNVTGGKGQQVAVPKPSPTVEATTDPTQAPSQEVKYKTETALAGQRQALGGVDPKVQSSPTPKPVAAPLSSPTPTSVAIASVPMPLPAPTTLLSTPIERGQTKEDPVEKWRTIAAMGSYGQVPAGGSNSAYPPPTPTPVPTPVFVPTPVAPIASASSATPVRQLRAGAATPGLRDRPIAMVLTGSSAAAQLATGVVLSGDNTTPINPDSPMATKYLVTLKAPLKDANGEEALPTGTSVVMVAKSFSPQSGLAEFQAVSVIVGNKEYALPTGALVVRGENGAPLTLAKRGGSGGSLFQSILPAFFAGISQAGQTLNQPTSSATVSGGAVSATTSSTNPSATAAFAQGFGQNLSQMLTQRSQAANQNQANQPNAWTLDAGIGVKVFVNSSFEM